MGAGEDSMPEELITPEMVESFVAETNDLLDIAENTLLEVEGAPSAAHLIDESFRSIHTVKGNAGFFGFSRIERMCMDIESKMDTVRKGNRKADQNLVTELLTGLDDLRNSLAEIAAEGGGGQEQEETAAGAAETAGTETDTAGGTPADKAEAAGADAGNADRTSEGEEEAGNTGEQEAQASGAPEEGPEVTEQPEEEPGASEHSDEEYKPLGDVLVEMGAAKPDDIEEALDEQQKKIGEILVSEGDADKDVVEKVLSEQAAARSEAEEKGQKYKIRRKDIRVDMNRLDKLFDLMGELITAEAMVTTHPELEGKELENFERAASSMGKITREMQEITMSIRMIPLEGLFNKMRRLVRDLARKFEKSINLHISGQETEMDRNVIEEISDPLVHIIRNAIDHGVEDTETRKAAGKDPTGNIWLNAKYEGNEIWITVQDDGGGLKREKILKKARENNLIEGDGSDMDLEDVGKLIFEPGFSTADKVSEISGRGVGMDVVKRNIDKLRGKIGIESEEGSGTAIILKIPLTLAIIDSIAFRVGSMKYCMPIDDVVEFQKIEVHQITQTGNGEKVLNLRNEILPIVELYKFYNIKSDIQKLEEGLFIILQAAKKKAAVFVDEIIGNRQVVIKPLPEFMGQIRAISGCSITGSGDISLIIDSSALVKEIFD